MNHQYETVDRVSRIFLPKFARICIWSLYRKLANPSITSNEIGRRICKKQRISYHSGAKQSSAMLYRKTQ